MRTQAQLLIGLALACLAAISGELHKRFLMIGRFWKGNRDSCTRDSQATSHSYNDTRDSPLKLDYAFNATPRVVSSLQESRIVNREIG